MARYNTYRSNAAEVPLMKKWFLRAAIVSVLAHAALFVYFRATKLDRFTPYTERLVPRAFSVGHAEIDAKLLKEDEEEKKVEPKKIEPEAQPAQPLLDEKNEFEKMISQARVKPDAPDEIKPILNEKPKVEAASLAEMTKTPDRKRDIERELDAVRDQLIKDKPAVSDQSLIKLSQAAKKTGNATAAPRNFSNLDALLGAGTLKGPVAPLNLPGGALFPFDSAEILPQAEEMLHKLARLIEKNPGATFEVEGYADSIGESSNEGHQHNLELSQRRADAVKQYLVARFHIDPARIASHGYGSTKYIVPPSGDAEKEAQNRRVEIVIHTQR